MYRIDKKEIRDLLGKGWLTHDGMWFYNTYRELGIEKANQLGALYNLFIALCAGDTEALE